jgi:hypothetical protein
MSNVLDDKKQQQILALGRLGWTLRRIERAVAVRRETVSGYLKAAGIPVGGRGRPSEARAKPAISGQVSTDSNDSKPATTTAGSTDLAAAASIWTGAERERVRAVPRDHRGRAGAWAQRRRHLAGPR